MQKSLWPEASLDELLSEIDVKLSTGMSGTLPVALLVAEDRDGGRIGFLEVGLRSHADGCDTARPVGYVEGLWVAPHCRNHGAARELMRAAEDWSPAQGALEIASDALIENIASQRAHVALGFEAGDRCPLPQVFVR